VNRVRGVLMLIAAAVAFWQGWRLRATHSAPLAVVLGVLALGLGVWHLTRKSPARRM